MINIVNIEKKEMSGRQKLLNLGIGESVDYPLTKLDSARSDSYRYGLQWGKKFKAKINRDLRVVTITRVE